uniref:Alpha/beta hydrolase fold-3 domain-containing protein n=1 Tax=Leersia perrieri TaxID=77586 RepID=A0A0D9WZ60_9ORYZ
MARSSPAMGAGSIAVDLYPFLRVYEGGHIERLVRNTAAVAPSHDGTMTAPAAGRLARDGVATRDVVIDEETGVSARLFLPGGVRTRLPLVLYFHGGAFVTGSAFGRLFHRYASSLAARAGALVVSVDYRLAPDHPLPAAFADGWAALRWATSLADPWLARYADPARVFLAGESAGATIAHNVAVRAAGPDGDYMDDDIEGVALLQPCFWGKKRLASEAAAGERDEPPMLAPYRLDALWPYVTGGAAGNDDPRIDPPAEDVSSLPCRRALVAVAEKDVLRERGRRYAAQLRRGGRDVTLVESEGEDHCFHLYRPARPSAVELMDRVAEFISPTSCRLQQKDLLHHLHGWQHNTSLLLDEYDHNTRAASSGAPKRDFIASGEWTDATSSCSGAGRKLDRPKAKVCGGPTCKAQTALVIGRRTGKAQWYGFVGIGSLMPSRAHKYSASATALRVLC